MVLQYSPESFSDTELDFALECCNGVIDVWQPTPERKMIINLPDTVQWTTPNVHADMIEWMCRHFENRESVIVSLHTHNDRGTGVAATELGLMAGADRVEGTLFGNGERTGNLDIVTVALNLNSHGIATGLDFSDLQSIRVVYERVTRLSVPERQPYAGELVFTAFSGSHQDAIKKASTAGRGTRRNPDTPWGVPYLTIDPQDIGRSYEAIIRINSQSGKGGVAYVLDREHGFDLPKSMHPQVGKRIYDLADEHGRELTTDEIREAFFEEFVNISRPLDLIDYELIHHAGERGQVHCQATILIDGEKHAIEGFGNGRSTPSSTRSKAPGSRISKSPTTAPTPCAAARMRAPPPTSSSSTTTAACCGGPASIHPSKWPASRPWSPLGISCGHEPHSSTWKKSRMTSR